MSRPGREPAKREPAPRNYTSYDEDSYKTVPPPRLNANSSFSSWNPPDKENYQPISPFASNPTHKYRNEYTATTNYRPTSIYTSTFDDIVSTGSFSLVWSDALGAFSSSLYSTTRLIERSRSRARERQKALRSQRSASNYYR